MQHPQELLRTSAKCSPVVGSSSTYRVCPSASDREMSSPLLNSDASLTRCASPPDRVVARLAEVRGSRGPRRRAHFGSSAGCFGWSVEERRQASSTVISSTSAIVLPAAEGDLPAFPGCTACAAAYFAGHVDTSGRKCISMLLDAPGPGTPRTGRP